jgi:cytochrome b561
MMGWTAVMFALQNWLAETPSQKATAATPAYFSVGMAVLALGVVRSSLPQFSLTPPYLSVFGAEFDC